MKHLLKNMNSVLFKCKLYNLLLILNAVLTAGNANPNFLNNRQELFKKAFHHDWEPNEYSCWNRLSVVSKEWIEERKWSFGMVSRRALKCTVPLGSLIVLEKNVYCGYEVLKVQYDSRKSYGVVESHERIMRQPFRVRVEGIQSHFE